MVAKRKFNKSRYLIAFAITLLIFIPGLLLGMVMDDARLSSLRVQSEMQELDLKSLQLNYLYISEFADDNNTCVPLKIALEKSIKDLSKSLEKIEVYKNGAKIENQDFTSLSRRYLLDNLNYWLLSKKTKEFCNLDTVNVLYFFNDDCNICPNQGIVLTYFKKKLGDRFLVFPINTGLLEEEPMISVLLNVYNVSSFPSLMIEDEVFEGIVETERMHQILCEKYKLNSTECEELI